MDKEEKVKEGESKRGELMVEKLKRGILVGKREGNSTPSPTWKFGLIQPDGTLVQDFKISTKSNALSARKLGANLWETQTIKNRPTLNHPKELDEAAAETPSEQPISGINTRKQVAVPLMQHHPRVKEVGQAQQPLSPASYSNSSREMAPHRPAITPNISLGSKSKSGESSHSLKTSTELLKVLNRIWSLEEKHALDMSLVKALRRELDESRAQNKELLQEKKRDIKEIDNLMKQITDYKVARKKEQDRIKELRRHSEKLHHKLAQELSEMKSSFSNAMRELERERKKRALLEDLCDEFAKGVRNYEQELRFMKQNSCNDQIGMEGNDRLILHISEAWLDERMQMKQANAHDNSEEQSVLDKLSFEIESFLRAKKSGNSEKDDYMLPKKPCESNKLAHSLESFHLNEPASAPWNGNDEDDSVGISHHSSQFCRGLSLKQKIGFARQQGEITSDGHVKETEKPKPMKKKVQKQLVNEESIKSGTKDLYIPRMPQKGEMMQRSSLEGKNRTTDADIDLQDTTTRNPSLTSEDKRLLFENNRTEGPFDPSMFTGPPSPVKKWMSEVSAADPDISASSSRWPQNLKPNTLKAKLMEARLEGQQSRARTSKGLSKVD